MVAISKAIFHYEQRCLENDLVALEPFDPCTHTTQAVEVIKANPDLFTYVSFPTIETEDDFIKVYNHVAESQEECLYAIFDKTVAAGKENGRSNFAGIISLNATSRTNAITEIGVIIFPEFQRTHVATNAIGLLLLWTLDPPSAGGLGLRRVEWRTHAANTASRRAALRMGFEFEGIARWQRVCPNEKVTLSVEALEKRNGTKEELPGRHTAIFSIVWDEWDEKRPKVLALMQGKQ
ncbi:acyl-CoA N-acyltransferase [Xylogone sp. PMI_703]|nr:acyl-CoA N-acyltransferase [Xylogone sp. PMI_703]